ncbi:MAG: glycosyltransferase family protein [Bacteroidales bacterium]
MKAYILISQKYSFAKTFEQIFRKTGFETRSLDYRSQISPIKSKINTQIFRLPHRYRQKWNNYFLKKINNWYIKQFRETKPDLLFIYNNEMLLPETLLWLKKQKTKIVFFLGDNPLYTHTNSYNLTILQYADLILVPDTFWEFQIKKMGIDNAIHFLTPLPTDEYHPVESANTKKYEKDVFYLGMSYKDSWGYKKARFLSYFTEFDLKIIGNDAWERWFKFYPELKSKFELQKGFMPTKELNQRYNAAKIIPVDGNPGIFNGIHARVTEALAAGTLPLMEYNNDMDFIFEGVNDLPAVKDYRQIPEMAKWYIEHNQARKAKVEEMTKVYEEKYNMERVINTITKNIF